MLGDNPNTTDTWLHHLIFRQEACPNKNDGCGIWFYTLTRCQREGKIEISGRMLSLISDGIESAASRKAAQMDRCEFRGVVYETVGRIRDVFDGDYLVVLDPIDPPDVNADAAHALLSNPNFNNRTAALLISAEVVRLHASFHFAEPRSEALRQLEGSAGIAV
jgi:hypothetical protein